MEFHLKHLLEYVKEKILIFLIGIYFYITDISTNQKNHPVFTTKPKPYNPPLNSIRQYDSDTPIILIPYDDNYQTVVERFSRDYGVKIYQDLEIIARLSNKLQQIFGNKLFSRPNQFRKQACWFGEFDEFLYIDTNIVVFDKIIDNLNYLLVMGSKITVFLN